jgi:hypothetical protein
LRLRFAQHAPDQFNFNWSPVITARLIGSIVLPDLRPLPKLTPGNAISYLLQHVLGKFSGGGHNVD